MQKLSDYDFDLPERLIAQNPLKDRTASKMMVVNSKTSEKEIRIFANIVDYFNENDCLIFNDTKVIPARIFGNKVLPDGSEGARIEALLLEQESLKTWVAMVRPGKRVKVGTKVRLSDADHDYFLIDEKNDDGTCKVSFPEVEIYELLDRVGHVPLPPYIKREDNADDRDTYQTIFADKKGAVAAPTAGLHFTDAILEQIKAKGVATGNVTLHVGPGTFQPVKVEDVTTHKMHSEQFVMPESTVEIIRQTKAKGGRVFAVGTTSVRVLESSWVNEQVSAGSGKTEIFIYPPYQPKVVDCLLTNFHLPKSTLLMLVSSFAGYENIMDAYKLAVEEEFRFFSYGDCMLIL